MNDKVWETALIFKTLAGSHLYGTDTPESDTDVRGVCHQTAESLIGLQGFEQYQDGKSDTTIFGLVKFCQLAAQCNPNIVELLFAPTEGATCLFTSEVWNELLSIRGAFLSRKARHTFTGYAYAQLKRIELHHRWLVNPPDHKPRQEEFGGIERPDGGGYHWPTQETHNAYQNAHAQWEQYNEWMDNRHPERAELERRFGYDTKHGLHLARLMTEGQELLMRGFITLPRPDARWLLEIRNGLMDYDQIVEWAAGMQKTMEELEETSPLPWGPDFDTIQNFVMRTNVLALRKAFWVK